MGRLLFWILLGSLVYALAKGWLRQGPARRPTAAASEPMVCCTACGLNVPQSEAHTRGGLWFCSREHLERPPSRG